MLEVLKALTWESTSQEETGRDVHKQRSGRTLRTRSLEAKSEEDKRDMHSESVHKK